MSLTRRLILSFFVILSFALLSILVHVWGSGIRSDKINELQVVMQSQERLRTFGQEFDQMHKNIRVIKTLRASGEMTPLTPAEVEEQLARVDSLSDQAQTLSAQLGELADDNNLSGVWSVLNYWRGYLRGQQAELSGQQAGAVEAEQEAPNYESVVATMIGLERALLARADEINMALKQAVTNINRISLGTFLLSLLVTIALALHLISFTRTSIRALHSGTEHWGGGNLDYQVPPLSGELGQLAESFNHMARNLRTAMNEVRAASRRADAANQAKTSFLANMSHELRTPMNAIIGYSEMLIEEAEDSAEVPLAEFANDLEKIHTAGCHLLSLINDVLDISKIESGRMTLYREDADLSRLLEEALVTVEPMVERNHNRLHYENTLENRVASIDVTRFKQVVLNLLSNAAKFTRDGEITVHLASVRTSAGEAIEVSVADTGIGMTEEQRNRVFDAFTQADLSTTKEFGGTGLGLTISRKFAELLGGDIRVESTFGQGSRFVFRVPRVAPRTELPAPPPDNGIPAADGSVLVVDDDPAAREITSRLLVQEGYAVIEAASGRDALEKAARADVIILDVMMPDMDGWQVLQELRATPETRGIPVVMQSMVSEHEMGELMEVDAYLVKPVDRDKLLATLGRVRQINRLPGTVEVGTA